jgi:hypothetical protein
MGQIRFDVTIMVSSDRQMIARLRCNVNSYNKIFSKKKNLVHRGYSETPDISDGKENSKLGTQGSQLLEPSSLYRSGEKPATANCPICEKIHRETSCIMVSWKNTQRAIRAAGRLFFLWRKPHEESFCWAVPCAG